MPRCTRARPGWTGARWSRRRSGRGGWGAVRTPARRVRRGPSGRRDRPDPQGAAGRRAPAGRRRVSDRVGEWRWQGCPSEPRIVATPRRRGRGSGPTARRRRPVRRATRPTSRSPGSPTPGSCWPADRTPGSGGSTPARARAIPGVLAVLTADDVPDRRYGSFDFVLDRTLFARDVVRFEGEVVAAVAALTPEIATAALDAIEVDYEDLAADPRPGGRARARLAARPRGRRHVRPRPGAGPGRQPREPVDGREGRRVGGPRRRPDRRPRALRRRHGPPGPDRAPQRDRGLGGRPGDRSTRAPRCRSSPGR